MPKANLQNLPSEWINSPSGNFYVMNDKYVSVIIADKQVITISEKDEVIEKYKEVFLRKCYEFFNKQDKKVKGGSLPAIDIASVVLEDNYIDPFPNINEKLLFSIESSKVDTLNSKSEKEYPEELFYSLKDFSERVDFVSKRVLEYQSEYLKDLFNKKTKPYHGLDFVSESSALKGFSDIIFGLSNINDVNSTNFEALILCFDDGEIKKISLDGFEGKRDLEVGISYYSKRFPLNKDTTLNLIKNLDLVYSACKDNSVTYQRFITNFLSKYKKSHRASTSPLERMRKDGSTYGITNKDVNQKFANSNEISKRFVKEFQNVAKQSLYQTPCLNVEQKRAKDLELEEQREQQETFASELNRSIGDSFLNSLPSVLASVAAKADKNGKQALDALGRDVLNRLGICGLGDLVAMVANTTTSFLDPEEYTSELTKCALDQVENNKLEKFSNNLEKFNRGPQILERYRSIVGSPMILPPWKTGGYTPPNSYYKSYFSDKYSIEIPLPNGEDYEIDFLFSSYREAVRLEVDPENILEALLTSFPDEMGWISFFIESTEILLTKCAPLKDMSVTLNSNLCNEKRFGFPDLPSVRVGPSGFSSPSSIANQLVEEMRNLIINLTVRAITTSMAQLMQIVAAGVSFDTNYFKRGDYIPDLFQNEDYIYNAFCDNSSNKNQNRSTVNSSVRAMLANSKSEQSINDNVSTEQIDNFLRKVSNSIGEYEKIKLFKGIAPSSTHEKVLLLAEQSGLSSYFKNHSDVEQFFLEMGKSLDVSKLEAKYFNDIYNYEPWSSFCMIESDMLDRAYFKNKLGITEQQVEKMKEKLKEIQKDKICFAANTLGSPGSPIIGKIGEMIADPKSDLYKKVRDKEAEYFTEGVNNIIDMIIPSYESELYKSLGVYDISMSKAPESGVSIPTLGTITSSVMAVGYNDLKFKSVMSETDVGHEVYTEDALNELKFSNFLPNDSNLNEIIFAELQKQEISNTDATQIIDYFNNNVLSTLIEKEFNNIKSSIKKSKLDNWEQYYKNTSKSQKIKQFLGISDSDLKEVYLEIEDFQIPSSKFVPFNLLKSKTELLNKYVSIMMYIRLLYTEYIIKSVNMFSTFKLETAPESLGFKSFIKEEIEDSELRDNIVQILFKLPIIKKETGPLRIAAVEINKGIQGWLRGDYASITNFYSSMQGYIDQVVDIFVNNLIKDYSKENLAAFFGKNLPEMGQAEISLGDIVDKNYPYNSDTYIRTEKYYDVGEPIGSRFISGIVSEEELLTQIDELDPEKKIKDIWPSGWTAGIRIVAVYPFSAESLTDSSQSLKKSTTIDQVVVLPLLSYEDKDSSIIKVKGFRDRTEALKDGLIKSVGYENYFYPSMNLEKIISFCANYYIDKIDTMIKTNFGQSDFFEETKKVLLEI